MDAVMEKFVEIFNQNDDWSRSHRLARRAGLMVFLHPKKDQDWVTGVKYDPDIHVLQPKGDPGFDGHHPMAWRRDFVETVVALGYVPNLNTYPPAKEDL